MKYADNIQLTATITVVFVPTIQFNVSFILNFIARESANDFPFTRRLPVRNYFILSFNATS